MIVTSGKEHVATGTRRIAPNDRRADLNEEIVDYWDHRSTTYSNYVLEGLSGEVHEAWRSYLAPYVARRSQVSREEGAPQTSRVPRVLDLGCGPGFFEVVLGEMGCEVHGVDTSVRMLARAAANLRAYGLAGSAHLHLAQADSLPFDSGSFDLVISRNVTWVMRDLERTYEEWHRVLADGGTLLVFDASWYSYLADARVDAHRRAVQAGGVPQEWSPDTLATSDEEKRCEHIAESLQTTYLVRPGWDVVTLDKLGYSNIKVDPRAGEVLLTQEELGFYAATPTFCIEASK